jgi:hypothetical protein
MQIPIVLSIYDSSKPSSYSNQSIKVDQNMSENLRTGRGNLNMMNEAQQIETDFSKSYFQDAVGQIKYKLVTGQMLDYRA